MYRGCCLECARTEQEPCGKKSVAGAQWECASGLSCLNILGLYIYLLQESVKLFWTFPEYFFNFY